LKLIRLPNLFFIVLTQFLFYYCILVPVLRSVGAVAKIDRLQFILLSLASVLIAAAGYKIINTNHHFLRSISGNRSAASHFL